jgi:pimeloyl-ACP methyl ester carboxylesterase
LILSAEHDRIALPRFGRSLASAIPGAVYEEVPNASHGVIIHDPETINRRLRSFVHCCESRATTAG